MQFQVPQFIEVEDKIFGPLTFKQFIYVGGGLGACYILWRVFPIYLAGPLIAAVGGLAASLAFFQINGRPFIVGLENGFFFFMRSKLYLWSNAHKNNAAPGVAARLSQGRPQIYVPKLSESKLHEMSWSLDIKERVAQGIASNDERRVGPDEDIMAMIHTPQQVRNRLAQETI